MSDTTASTSDDRTDGAAAPAPTSSDDDVKVVLESTLLTCPEVFVYRIPPMMTSGGHRAEDWNLASPLETCSLVVKRVDSSCYLSLMSEKPKPNGPPGATEPHLFAKCHIALDFDDETKKLEHWVEAVVDSSRYSAIRISDDSTGREAHIGMGFRERNDAVNFKMALQEYENALRRERKAEAMHMAYEKTQEGSSGAEGAGEGVAAGAPGGDSLTPPSSGGGPALPAVAKLTLKEGEKIHVNLKGVASKDGGTRRVSAHGLSGRKAPPPGALVGKGGLLLKKPPPAVDGGTAAAAAAAAATAITAKTTETITDGNEEEDGSSSSLEEAVESKSSTKPVNETSTEAATPSNVESELDRSSKDDDDVDDDEWGDFEGGAS